MSWRTVVVSNHAKLDYRMGYLVVRGIETKKVLIDEIKALVIENPAISLTGVLIEVLVEKKVKVIFCDSTRNPIAELIPHHGSYDCSSKIRIQTEWTEAIKSKVWQEIVAEKIRKQESFLRSVGKDKEAEMLRAYSENVEPRDCSNREGHSAKVYFNALFGMRFTRSEECPTNAALNYGYSIILSAFNREIASNGYLTQMGIFHSNMFNPYNLGCDLMETYRVIVDRLVYYEKPQQFTKDEKHCMWSILDEQVLIDGSKQTLSNAIKIYTRSIFDAINEQDVSYIKNYSML